MDDLVEHFLVALGINLAHYRVHDLHALVAALLIDEGTTGLATDESELVLLNQALDSLILSYLFWCLTILVDYTEICVVQQQLLHDLDGALLACCMQGCAMERRHEIDICLLAQKQNLDSCWLQTTNCNVQGSHLRVMCQLIWICRCLKE